MRRFSRGSWGGERHRDKIEAEMLEVVGRRESMQKRTYLGLRARLYMFPKLYLISIFKLKPLISQKSVSF
jgi:hypothetical protein